MSGLQRLERFKNVVNLKLSPFLAMLIRVIKIFMCHNGVMTFVVHAGTAMRTFTTHYEKKKTLNEL